MCTEQRLVDLTITLLSMTSKRGILIELHNTIFKTKLFSYDYLITLVTIIGFWDIKEFRNDCLMNK